MIKEKTKIQGIKNNTLTILKELLTKYKYISTLHELYKEDMEKYPLTCDKSYEITYHDAKYDRDYPVTKIDVTADDLKKILPVAANDANALSLIDGYENFRKGIDELKNDKKLIKNFPNIPKKKNGEIIRLDFIVYFLHDEISNNMDFMNAIINYIVLEEFRHNSVHNKREISLNNKKKIIESINNFFKKYNFNKTKLADLIIQALQNKNLLAINLIKDKLNDNVADYLLVLHIIFDKLCDNMCCKLDELNHNNS